MAIIHLIFKTFICWHNYRTCYLFILHAITIIGFFHISKKGTYSGSAISNSKQLSRCNWEHTESLFCTFVLLILSLVFTAGRNVMPQSPYLLTDQNLHSPTPVVPSISAPSTPLPQHGISSVGNVSSLLQKGT